MKHQIIHLAYSLLSKKKKVKLKIALCGRFFYGVPFQVRLFALAFFPSSKRAQINATLLNAGLFAIFCRAAMVLYILNNLFIFIIKSFKFWHYFHVELKTISPSIFIMHTKLPFKRNIDSMNCLSAF